MSKRDILIEEIEKFNNKYFNEDQKLIAIDILRNCPEKEVQAYADFLFSKRRTGFSFDYSPEIARGRIITLREDKSRRINVDDNINKNENKLIIGDNYNALTSLSITHEEKIDVIYIDPPYNTEKAKDEGNNDSYKEGSPSKFYYKDKFGRTGWLTMMKNRLTIAKGLLKDDGVIFISIDDTEQAYLKVLMDEIFGEENFIANIIWKNRTTPNDSKINIATTHEYILTYGKNKQNVIFKGLNRTFENYKNLDNDPKGPWIKDNPSAASGNYSFKIKNPYTNEEYYPPKGRYWAFSEKRVNEWTESGKMVFSKEKGGSFYIKKYKSELKNETLTHPSIFFTDALTMNGTKEIRSILENKLFSYPKPIKLIEFLINLLEKKNLTILDFFAGSGTTGQAVMNLNRKDKGKRRFILVTNNENNIAHDITYERLYRVIKGEGTKKEKDFNWLRDNKPYSEVNLRVIDIDDSIKISLDQEKFDEIIFEDCEKGLKLLDCEYNKKDLDLYYDLAALNPLEKIGE
ncbi:MAG: site-specific DNA-methyltransferase [Mycoplasmoidaceae bacterium]